MKTLSCHILTFICITFLIISSILSTEVSKTDTKHGSGEKHHKAGDPDISIGAQHYDNEGHHDEDFDHEAITGSHKEALEFKELSPEESRKRLSVLIGRMDENKDGNINKVELTNWIIKSLMDLDQENANNRIDEHDENNDKQVTWEEYMQRAHGYSLDDMKELENDTSEDSHQLKKTILDERMKFDLADQDKNGILTALEYTAFTHPQNNAHMAPYEVMRTLDDYDHNKDGVIDLAEYLGKEKLDEEIEKTEREHFASYDKNKSGTLDKQEIVEWIMPGFEPTAKSEAGHLFAETDKDKNELLSSAEILEQTDLWVGSQATDYGKHLDDLKKDEL